jgi:hypothetical protein
MGDLTKLTKLRKISIIIGQESAPYVNEFKKIGEINALRSLFINHYTGIIAPREMERAIHFH